MRQSIPYDKELSEDEKAKLEGLAAIYGDGVSSQTPISSEILNTVDQNYVDQITGLPVNTMDNFSMVPSQESFVRKTDKLPIREMSQIPQPSKSPSEVSSQPMLDERSPKVEALKQTLAQKYGLDKFSNEERNKIQSQIAEENAGFNWMGALAAVGGGLQGHNAVQAGMDFVDKQRAQRSQKLTDFDKSRSQAIENVKLGQEMQDYEDKDSLRQREMDVNSQESKLARTLASKMLPSKDFSQMTAAQINKALPSLSKMYEIEQKKLDRQDARALLNASKQEKLDEKMQGLKTPVGIANTVEDAKNLKEGYESKKAFDSKIDELIALRKQYGGEVFNREAVARGKQLSKDLLLEYKNMAKLGVLSKSDEDIINAIIPADPLAFTGAALVGQDPILNNLESFKRDSDRDFNTKVSTRTREGLKSQPKEETKQNTSKKSWMK